MTWQVLAVAVPVLIFLFTQTGLLIWFLGRHSAKVETKIDTIFLEIKSLKFSLRDLDEAVGSHDSKIAAVEAQCLARHGRNR